MAVTATRRAIASRVKSFLESISWFLIKSVSLSRGIQLGQHGLQAVVDMRLHGLRGSGPTTLLEGLENLQVLIECLTQVFLIAGQATEAAHQPPITSHVFSQAAIAAVLGDDIVKLKVELDRSGGPIDVFAAF